VKVRENDSKEKWLGDVVTSKGTKQTQAIETDVPLYEAAMKKLKDDSIAFADIHLAEPRAEHARYAASMKKNVVQTTYREPSVWIPAVSAIIVVSFLFLIFRGRF
jgi:hypothetical protein